MESQKINVPNHQPEGLQVSTSRKQTPQVCRLASKKIAALSTCKVTGPPVPMLSTAPAEPPLPSCDPPPKHRYSSSPHKKVVV
jgi:hypothetical protein